MFLTLLFWALIAVCILGLLLRFVINPMTQPATNGLLEDGRLSPCPDTPNCVSSQTDKPSAYIDPIETQADDPIAAARDLLPQLGKHILRVETNEYLHVEMETPLLAYRDDLELVVDPDDGQRLHVRSASRLGRSDLGANRKRVEQLRSLLSQDAQAAP